MPAAQVKITKDGQVAEVAEMSVRVWLDRGWKLVVENEEPHAPAEGSEDSDLDGNDPVVPTPAQSPARALKASTPAESGQEA